MLRTEVQKDDSIGNVLDAQSCVTDDLDLIPPTHTKVDGRGMQKVRC